MSEQIKYLLDCIKFVNSANSKISWNVFLHKTDNEVFSTEEKKLGKVTLLYHFLIIEEYVQVVNGFVKQELEDISLENIKINYHITS